MVRCHEECYIKDGKSEKKGSMALKKLLAIAVASLWLLAGGFAQAGDANEQAVVQSVMNMHFVREAEGQYRFAKSRRWARDMRVALLADDRDAVGAVVDGNFARIQAETPLSYRTLGVGEQPNILFVVSDDPYFDFYDANQALFDRFFAQQVPPGVGTKSFLALAKKRAGLCSGYIGLEESAIHGAIIMVSTEMTDLGVRRCIARETMRALGMFNENFAVGGSVLERNGLDAVSETDLAYLNILYGGGSSGESRAAVFERLNISP